MPIDIFGRTDNTNSKAQARTQIFDFIQVLKHYDFATKEYVNVAVSELYQELMDYLRRVLTNCINRAVTEALTNLENSSQQ